MNNQNMSHTLNNSDSNWKILNDEFKKPLTVSTRISLPINYKKEIRSALSESLDMSSQKFGSEIQELNFLQHGEVYIHYKNFGETRATSNTSKRYFIDDSDDSENEYFDSEEIMNRIVAEQKIIERVHQLQKDDCWSLKMLSKRVDPPRPTFHWDLLIKEMKWQHNSMMTRKQVKRSESKKLAVAANKYLKEKEAQSDKMNKEATVKAKKHCSVIARSIREWWKQMEKIVQAKHKFRLDSKRQEALNTHLGKVLETTEKYMEWLAEDIKGASTTDYTTSVVDDPDYQLKEGMLTDTDDEETIEKEEFEINYDIKEEIESLKREQEKSLDEILKELPEDYFTIKEESKLIENVQKRDILNSDITIQKTDEESNLSEESDDFEETMVEQEIFETNMIKCDGDSEIKELENDADIPMDDLIKMYNEMYNINSEPQTVKNKNDSSFSSENCSTSSESNESYESSVDLGLEFNIENEPQFPGEFQEISEVALSTQPRGFTLESTEVQVQIPDLLKGTLREYQHVGLDWLAAIYEKRLNGVLADEMGLGKTIQTIALLAYMACEKMIWGPHLVVVPTSVVLNWEIEFKKWCPGFKILTYFGTFKERKEKRKGWTKTNAFHVCITSYKLAIQDCAAFKRKKWKYMILDEAQNIKNFKSQRWQTLLTFNSQRRLLLTGTPLQNNLMELWSLMHFLMPNIFQSHREFNDWFGTPLSGMIEGSKEYNEQLILRLHKVLRPFILRRLKKDVEKQMPQKYNHIIMCHLSKRQRFLYDDYMSMSSTSETLASGQFMSVLNILMQLRKVCNHPNLFEERPTLSPFSMASDYISYNYPKILLIDDLYQRRNSNDRRVFPSGIIGLADMSINLPTFVSERISELKVKKRLLEDVDSIITADWVTKHNEKNSETPLRSTFIPHDLIDYLNSSDSSCKNPTLLETPAIHGLLVRRDTFTGNSNLPQKIIDRRHQQRQIRLKFIAYRNAFRCSQISILGPDIVSSLTINKSDSCLLNQSIIRPRPLDEFIEDNMDVIQRVNFVIPSVVSRGVRLHTSANTLNQFQCDSEKFFAQHVRDIPDCLIRIRQRQLVQFPDSSLIEYDCGKLQVLVGMLSRLKAEGHRCLIFTQMTRMLDVLEQFLSYHGHRYLRLDGTTKIEQRQVMMEQFNKDEKIFVFILSTRSGGVGVNLTGADTVIFYDSDWNPTMDAQAQDRCHRIGQTRDVHIYRLISKMTIEENILKKANEKRYLNEMAIEGGQFNMSFFKNNTLQDIFENPSGLDDLNIDTSPVEQSQVYTSSRGRVVKWKGGKPLLSSRSSADLQDLEKTPNIDTTQLEAALDEIEDENDRLAAKITKAEVKADLLEFDESVPWEDTEENLLKGDMDENKYRQEMESHLANFNKQLDPIQRYGVGLLEDSLGELLFDELEREETNIENSKQTWHLDQIKALHEDKEGMKEIEEDDMMYIYGEFDPCAAQKEELEKLRREEEFQMLEEHRREEELAQIEKDKAAAHVWAQEQHLNALKRKHNTISDDEESLGTNSDSIPKKSRERKVIVARFELPDESITMVNTSQLSEIDPPMVSSSSGSMITESLPFPIKRRKGRPAWKNLTSNIMSQSPISRSQTLWPPINNASPMATSLSSTTVNETVRRSYSMNRARPKIQPQENTSQHNGFSKVTHNEENRKSTLQTPSHLMYEDPPIVIPGIKKKRGRPFLIKDLPLQSVPVVNEASKQHSVSEPSSAAESKKNFFKIPVKTLSGERKLFSAPLLLMKTKPVFIITRKIEDERGNVYTQNLTYPVVSSDRFNEISATLTKFASNSSHEKN